MKKKQFTTLLCLLLAVIITVIPAISTQAKTTAKNNIYYAETDEDEIIAVQRALFNRESKFTIRYLAKKADSFSYYAKDPERYIDKFYSGDKFYDKYAWQNGTYNLFNEKGTSNSASAYENVKRTESYVTAKGQAWLNIEYQYLYGEYYGYTFFSPYADHVKLYKGVRKLIADSDITDKTDYEKAKWIYEWICENVKYKHSDRDQEAYSAFVLGHAVCNGYSLLFEVFAEELGLTSQYVSGNVTTSPIDHAWNTVELDGKWYLIDTTWGVNSWTSNKDPYKYFLRGSDFLNQTHLPKTKIYPTESISATDFTNTNSIQKSYVLANIYDIKFDPVHTERLNIGEEYQWLLENKTDIQLTFTSSNPSVVSISDNGKIKGLKKGQSTITVTNEEKGIKQSIEITVVKEAASLKESDKPAKAFPIPNATTVTVGKKVDGPIFKDYWHKDWYRIIPMKYKIQDKTIATVNKNGVITGIKAGKTTVTLTDEYGNKMIFPVTVKKAVKK